MSKAAVALTIFKAGSLPTPEAGATRQLPTSLLVMPWGTCDTSQGKVTCNERTLAVLMANQRAMKFDRVALDFQHNTVETSPTYRGEPAKVACFGAPRVERDKGIFIDIDAQSWTPEGKAAALDGHYPDLSPAVKRDPNDPIGTILFLHSVALARQGEVDGLTLFNANIDNANLMDLNNLDPAAVRTSANIFLTKLGVAIIADDATPDVMLAAINTGLEKITSLSTVTQPDATLAAKPADITALNARLDKIEQGQTATQRRALVERASCEGKVIGLTDAELETIPLTTLSALVEKLPVTVPLESRTGNLTALAARTSNAALTEQQKEIAKNCGITEEQFKKANSEV